MSATVSEPSVQRGKYADVQVIYSTLVDLQKQYIYIIKLGVGAFKPVVLKRWR